MMVVEMEAYAHLVEIDEEKRQLLIYRIRKNGKKQLFTSVDLPSKTFAEDEDGFRRFSTYLGENLLVDSPVARKLLGL
jgi:hypothetical protein